MNELSDIVEPIGELCQCGLGPGYTCAPDCPAYRPPPPTEVKGVVDIGNKVVYTQERVALKSSYITVAIATTDTTPFPLLGQDDGRKRAIVISDAVVMLGKKMQLGTGQALAGITGFRLVANVSLEIQNQDELYVLGTGVAANVSVLNERWI